MSTGDDEYRYFFPRDEFALGEDDRSSQNSGRERTGEPNPNANDAAADGNSPPSAAGAGKAVEKQAADSWSSNDCGRSDGAEPSQQSMPTLLSVYALGQFEYCSRAGILAVESNHGEEEFEERFQLDYLPNYELAKIEEHLKNRLNALLGWTVSTAGAMYGVRLGMLWRRPLLGTTGFLAAAFGMLAMTNQARLIVQLAARRIAAQQAVAEEPSLSLTQVTHANWWSLLRCGWQSLAYPRAMRHPSWSLVGNPWRILHRDSCRIPVIQSGVRRLGPHTLSVYAKHEVRLAAYAALLEATEHVHVPYGLIFPRDSHRGLAVPLLPSLRQSLPQRISQALNLLQQTQQDGLDPRVHADASRCHSCELGFPKPLSPRELSNAQQERRRLVVLDDAQKNLFHCECADRFGTAPPHTQITKRGLRIRPS